MQPLKLYLKGIKRQDFCSRRSHPPSPSKAVKEVKEVSRELSFDSVFEPKLNLVLQNLAKVFGPLSFGDLGC